MLIKRTIKNTTIALVLVGSAPVFAQTNEPLSAIEWLSDVIRNPEVLALPKADDISKNASPTQIVTTPLGQIKIDAVGLLPSSVTGLSPEFWGTTGSTELQDLILSQRTDLPPPLAAFLKRLLLAELTPPPDSDEGGGLFLARVDKLLDMGALDEARALVERAGPNTPELFRRWFDIGLLTGLEDQACRVMLAKPEIAPTYPARIFCLARGGDWSAAAVTLNTAKLLDLIDDQEEALMARFLDPELFEGEPPLTAPRRITPLAYKMHSAIGEPLQLTSLPNAFAYAALSPTEGWKQRINAAERLVRTGALPAQTLMEIYKERKPAASGGVWDRVEAVQSFDAALLAGDGDRITADFDATLRPLRRAGLEAAFAKVYGDRLARLPLGEGVAVAATRIELMSDSYEAVAQRPRAPDDTPQVWLDVARGSVDRVDPSSAVLSAVTFAFSDKSCPAGFLKAFERKNYGEIALQALILLQDGPDASPSNIETGLKLLRKLGLEDIARRTAMHIMLARPK
jgi:hypothetical protein